MQEHEEGAGTTVRVLPIPLRSQGSPVVTSGGILKLVRLSPRVSRSRYSAATELRGQPHFRMPHWTTSENYIKRQACRHDDVGHVDHLADAQVDSDAAQCIGLLPGEAFSNQVIDHGQ